MFASDLIENTEITPDESEVMPNSGSSAPPGETMGSSGNMIDEYGSM